VRDKNHHRCLFQDADRLWNGVEYGMEGLFRTEGSNSKKNGPVTAAMFISPSPGTLCLGEWEGGWDCATHVSLALRRAIISHTPLPILPIMYKGVMFMDTSTEVHLYKGCWLR
jgi:hypothetical protein